MKGKSMGRIAAVMAAGALLIVSLSAVAWGANKVEIGDLSLGDTDTGSVGIHIENDAELGNIVIPLIVRNVTGGAFWASGSSITFNPSARLQGKLTGAIINSKRNGGTADCEERPPGSGQLESDTAANWNFVSPNGALLSKVSIFPPSPLPPGSDGEIGSGVPSLLVHVVSNGNAGSFEIDTTCIRPANDLSFNTPDATAIKPTFRKSMVTVGTAVHDLTGSSGVPDQYELKQNHPNPFNASTLIQFTNRRDGRVKLEVFNILGQSVRTLMDEWRAYGTYAVDWDGRDQNGRAVSSGMYFYRLTSGEFSDVKKMVLLK